ncbi:MAG TPA: chemotaxis protein CheW [Rhizomicrobium sp.]
MEDDLIKEFLTETGESLATLDLELVRLEQDANDPALLSNIFRLMHTIKGTCGFLGLMRLGAVAHAGENILGKFRDGELAVTPAAVTLILTCIDQIRALLSALEETGKEPPGCDDHLIAEIDAFAAGTADTQQVATIDTVLPASFDIEGGFPVAAELLLEVEQALAAQGAPASQPMPAAPSMPALDHVPAAPPRAADSAPAAEHRESALANASIRVNVDVIETQMNLISELVLIRNQLMQTARRLPDSDFKVPLQRLSHITSDLQEVVTRMRMQPIGNAWAKLSRIVRDLSVDSGKKIQLVQQGAETELDRQVLELIKDPLTHMVRNSADHGIEDPATRLAAGKPESGTITLEACHESGRIVIRIADDGRGLDVERIRAKAAKNGLATEAELAVMSEQQILQFIFKPGFSTAEKVTAVSGRGVGMDVVRTNIERIGGAIDIKSVMGQGSEFTIKIPLTLAIISALIVESGKERFAIPQINIIELVRVSAKSGMQIETVNTSQVLRLRDRLLPLVSLGKLLKMDGAEAPVQDDEENRFIMVTQVGPHKFGIIVDRVFDTEEIVVKPVSHLLRGISAFAGNTILGDGSVIMILDPSGLAGTIGQAQLGANEAAETAEAAALQAANENGRAAFLLFRAGGGDLKAVPLELVARIEDFDVASIERARGQHVVQYRDHLVPLVNINPEHVWKESGKQQVLIFADDGRTMGLVVDEIVDIVQDTMSVELSSDAEGLVGSAIISGKATDIIDIGHYLTLAFADWFERERLPAQETGKTVRKVLVVDDSPFFRNMLSPLLVAAGCQVTTAGDGTDALRLRDEGHAFDLIISDIDMPRMDGLTLAQEVRKDPAWQATPMIALSGRANEADIAAGTAAGFNHYFGKNHRMSFAKDIKHVLDDTMLGRHREAQALRQAI